MFKNFLLIKKKIFISNFFTLLLFVKFYRNDQKGRYFAWKNILKNNKFLDKISFISLSCEYVLLFTNYIIF